MPCQILVSNKVTPNAGNIIVVVDGNHTFSKKETMAAFIASGGLFEDWSRAFSLVKVTDKTKAELNHLDDITAGMTKQYGFTTPATGSAEWLELYNTGEIERDWATINAYVVDILA